MGRVMVAALCFLLVAGTVCALIEGLPGSEERVRMEPKGELSAEVSQVAAVQMVKQTPLEKKLRASGFEDDSDTYMLVKRYMVLKDLCKLMNCKPSDFMPPKSPGYPGLPPMDFQAPNAWLLQRPGCLCSIWFLDPDRFPKDIGEAEVQVGFFLYVTDEVVRGAGQF